MHFGILSPLCKNVWKSPSMTFQGSRVESSRLQGEQSIPREPLSSVENPSLAPWWTFMAQKRASTAPVQASNAPGRFFVTPSLNSRLNLHCLEENHQGSRVRLHGLRVSIFISRSIYGSNECQQLQFEARVFWVSLHVSWESLHVFKVILSLTKKFFWVRPKKRLRWQK